MRLSLATLLVIGTAAAQYSPPLGGGVPRIPNVSTPQNTIATTGLQVNGSTLVDFEAVYSVPRFYGVGLNDAFGQGPFTGVTQSGAVFTVIIDGTGTPNTISWSKNGGTLNSLVPITGAGSTGAGFVLSDGVILHFLSATGHTINDTWILSGASGAWQYAPVNDNAWQTPFSVSLGSGAGNVTNGQHYFQANWVTAEGEGYPAFSSSQNATVVDNSVNGKINIGTLPTSTDLRVKGVAIYATKANAGSSSQYYFVTIVPPGSNYVFNKPDTALVATPSVAWNQITTTAPCFNGEELYLYRDSCMMQFFDYGVRFPTFVFMDRTPNGILGTQDGFVNQYVGSTGTVACWKTATTIGFATVAEITSGTCH